MSERLLNILERKVPETFMVDSPVEQKLSVIIDEWKSLHQNNNKLENQFFDTLKDLEYTLNLLNIASTFITDEKFKNDVEKWLDYYRKISN